MLDEVRELGFSQGEPVYLKLDSTCVDGDSADFIRGSTEGIGRNDPVLKHRSDGNPELHVVSPAEYTFRRENQVFHGLKPEHEITVEVNYSEGEFRVYRSVDYPIRMKELSDLGVFPSLRPRCWPVEHTR